jgi:DNA-binding FadR family transcriptional regulator
VTSRDPAERWLTPGPAGAPTILEPVRMRSAGEHIADRIVTAIALGEFVPGQRLPTERDLASMLNVSRTTVREAVQRLAALGYVDVRRGRNGGAFVLQGWGPDAADMIRRTLLPGWDRFERLFDFRQLIEPLIARTAAERRTDEDSALIRVTLDAYRDAGTDREASRAADEALHAAVAHATQNPYLENRFEKVAYGLYPCFGGPPAKPDAQGPSRLEPEVIAQSEAKTPAQPETQAAAPPPQENKPA